MANAESLLEMLKMEAEPVRLSDSALIVVDAQKEYSEGNVKLTGVDAALEEIHKLLTRARSLNIPIFHIVHHAPAGAPIFDPTGPMVEIADPAKPAGDEAVISKNLPSSFVGTDLDEQLKKTGKKNLVITGFMTHMCVNATTRSALDLGYSPTVVASCCATRDLPGPADGEVIPASVVHSSNLASLADLVAAVIPEIGGLEN